MILQNPEATLKRLSIVEFWAEHKPQHEPQLGDKIDPDPNLLSTVVPRHSTNAFVLCRRASGEFTHLCIFGLSLIIYRKKP